VTDPHEFDTFIGRRGEFAAGRRKAAPLQARRRGRLRTYHLHERRRFDLLPAGGKGGERKKEAYYSNALLKKGEKRERIFSREEEGS